MKKVLFTILLSFLLIGTTYANWLQLPNTNHWYYLKENNQPAKNEWLEIDTKGNGVVEYYYFGADGILLQNTVTPDGYTVNGDGAWVINGVVQTKSYALKSTSIDTTNMNVVSSSNEKKELKNAITTKSGVDFIDTKKINGASWVNVIRMNGRDSFLKANSGKCNQLKFEAGVVKVSDNAEYLITVYVNGEEYGQFNEENINTGESIIIDFDPNSEIMLIYTVSSEGSYLSQDNQYLYLRNAKFSTSRN